VRVRIRAVHVAGGGWRGRRRVGGRVGGRVAERALWLRVRPGGVWEGGDQREICAQLAAGE